MRNIPFLNFSGIHDPIKTEMLQAVERVMDSKWFILGQEVTAFEKEFAEYCNVEYAIGVNSGLDALIIALKALGIGPGDEVIVASNAYIACWNAIHAVGAKIIPVEPDPITFNINPNHVHKVITPSTKAIMAVHLYGRACAMDSLGDIARLHHLAVIEDNAQAHGATFNAARTASIGHINATSFYPGKNLGALGDGGMVTTSSKELAEFAFSYRNYGSTVKYTNTQIGINSRLDEMQAAILRVKLKRLEKWNKERVEIAQTYHDALNGIENIGLPEMLTDGSHVYHIFNIIVKQRDQLQKHLKECGIGTLIHYPIPPHLQEAYKDFGFHKGDFPIAERLANESLSLPIYPGLQRDDVLYICEKIKAFLG